MKLIPSRKQEAGRGNYLAFHCPPLPPSPLLSAHYQHRSPPNATSIPFSSPSVSVHRLILHSAFVCVVTIMSSRAAFIQTGRGLKLFGYKWRNSEGDKTGREQSVTRRTEMCVYVCACVCVSLFVFCRVKVLISLAGTVPTTLICQAALSPGEGKVNVWEEALRGWKRVNWCLEWHQGQWYVAIDMYSWQTPIQQATTISWCLLYLIYLCEQYIRLNLQFGWGTIRFSFKTVNTVVAKVGGTALKPTAFSGL